MLFITILQWLNQKNNRLEASRIKIQNKLPTYVIIQLFGTQHEMEGKHKLSRLLLKMNIYSQAKYVFKQSQLENQQTL